MRRTLRENISLALTINKVPWQQIGSRVQEAAESLGMIQLRSVVLPEPEAPMIPRNSPSSTVKLISLMFTTLELSLSALQKLPHLTMTSYKSVRTS